MSCKTCRWWELPAGESARRRVGRRCLAPLPEMVLPDSITKYRQSSWPPPRMSMWADDGEACPTWEKTIREPTR